MLTLREKSPRRPRAPSGPRGSVSTLGSFLVVGPDLRLGQTLAHPPDDGGDDEQVQEDQPRTEKAQRRQRGGEGEPDQRADRPGQLGGADVLGAAVRRRLLGDVGPRGGNARTDGDAGDDEGGQQHRVVDGEGGQQHAGHVDQKVVGVDRLAAEAVTQRSAEDRADGGAEGVGAQRRKQSDGEVADAELGLPEGQAGGDRDDGSGLDVVGHGDRDGRPPAGRRACSDFHGRP